MFSLTFPALKLFTIAVHHSHSFIFNVGKYFKNLENGIRNSETAKKLLNTGHMFVMKCIRHSHTQSHKCGSSSSYMYFISVKN